MKKATLTLAIVFVAAILFSLTPQAWCGDGEGAGEECCVVVNPGGGALALKGTGSFVYDRVNGKVYFTLRVERSGETHVFRLYLETTLENHTDAEIACKLLDPDRYPPGTANYDRVYTFVDSILDAFFPPDQFDPGHLPGQRELVITNFSIQNNQGVLYCTGGDPNNTPDNCMIPGTNGQMVSTVGELIFYIVDYSKATYVDGVGCI